MKTGMRHADTLPETANATASSKEMSSGYSEGAGMGRRGVRGGGRETTGL